MLMQSYILFSNSCFSSFIVDNDETAFHLTEAVDVECGLNPAIFPHDPDMVPAVSYFHTFKVLPQLVYILA